jgi:predicted DNA-binding WGR domain protein
MSDWTVHLEFEEGTSSKFWRARVDGKTLYVNYGKIGSAGQTQVKDFGDAGGAAKEYDKLVREKRKKGYVDAGGGGGGGGGDAEEDEDEDGGGGDDEGGDDDEDEAPAPKKKSVIAAAAATTLPAPVAASGKPPTARLELAAGGRKVDTALYLDGKTLKMESTETYASPEAAKKAYERLKKMLVGEGYKEG